MPGKIAVAKEKCQAISRLKVRFLPRSPPFQGSNNAYSTHICRMRLQSQGLTYVTTMSLLRHGIGPVAAAAPHSLQPAECLMPGWVVGQFRFPQAEV